MAIIWELIPRSRTPMLSALRQRLILEETKSAEEAGPVIRKMPKGSSRTLRSCRRPSVLPWEGGEFVMEPSDIYYIPEVLNAGFITERELEDSGTIDHTREEKRLLTDDNIVFIKLSRTGWWRSSGGSLYYLQDRKKDQTSDYAPYGGVRDYRRRRTGGNVHRRQDGGGGRFECQ